MQQKWSKLDHMTSMNILVQNFYKSDHVWGVFTYPHYIAFPSVECLGLRPIAALRVIALGNDGFRTQSEVIQEVVR